MSSKGKNNFEGTTKSVLIDDSPWFEIIIAVIVIFITLVILALWRRKRNARQGVLIMGLCDSGKTLIFSQLVHGKCIMTQTSIKENSGEYELKKGSLKLVDIPGHERVRGKFFDDYKGTCRAVMFVVDSVTFQKEIRDVAECLYTVLTDSALVGRKTGLLIVCNKQDQTMAKGSKVIRNLLENELNILRSTKSHQLSSIEGSNNNVLLGHADKDFEFHHASFDVQFCEAHAFCESPSSQPDLDGVIKWLNSIA